MKKHPSLEDRSLSTTLTVYRTEYKKSFMQLKQTGLILVTTHHSNHYLIYISLKFPDSTGLKKVSRSKTYLLKLSGTDTVSSVLMVMLVPKWD